MGNSITACKKHHERVTGEKVQTDLRKVRVPLSQEQIRQYTQLLQSRIRVHLTPEQIMYAKKSKKPTETKCQRKTSRRLSNDDKKLPEDGKQPSDAHNEENGWDNEEEVSNDMNRQDETINCDFDSTDGTKGLGNRKQHGQTPRGGEKAIGTSSYAKAGSRNDVNLKSKEKDVERISEQANGHISPEVLETLLPERPVVEDELGDIHIKKISCQDDTPDSKKYFTASFPMKTNEAFKPHNSNEDTFTSKLHGPESYQHLSRGSVQQPHNDDNEEQHRHGTQTSHPFHGSDFMSEDYAASNNEKVGYCKDCTSSGKLD